MSMITGVDSRNFTGAFVPGVAEDRRAARVSLLAEILRAEKAAGVTRTGPKALALRAASMGIAMAPQEISRLVKIPGVIRTVWNTLGARKWGEFPHITRTGWVLA